MPFLRLFKSLRACCILRWVRLKKSSKEGFRLKLRTALRFWVIWGLRVVQGHRLCILKGLYRDVMGGYIGVHQPKLVKQGRSPL